MIFLFAGDDCQLLCEYKTPGECFHTAIVAQEDIERSQLTRNFHRDYKQLKDMVSSSIRNILFSEKDIKIKPSDKMESGLRETFHILESELIFKKLQIRAEEKCLDIQFVEKLKRIPSQYDACPPYKAIFDEVISKTKFLTRRNFGILLRAAKECGSHGFLTPFDGLAKESGCAERAILVPIIFRKIHSDIEISFEEQLILVLSYLTNFGKYVPDQCCGLGFCHEMPGNPIRFRTALEHTMEITKVDMVGMKSMLSCLSKLMLGLGKFNPEVLSIEYPADSHARPLEWFAGIAKLPHSIQNPVSLGLAFEQNIPIHAIITHINVTNILRKLISLSVAEGKLGVCIDIFSTCLEEQKQEDLETYFQTDRKILEFVDALAQYDESRDEDKDFKAISFVPSMIDCKFFNGKYHSGTIKKCLLNKEKRIGLTHVFPASIQDINEIIIQRNINSQMNQI